MGNWLQQILAPQQGKKGGAVIVRKGASVPAQSRPQPPSVPPELPNATIIYGVGASLLFAASFSLLWHGRWLPGVLVFILGGILTGFALHLLKHQD